MTFNFALCAKDLMLLAQLLKLPSLIELGEGWVKSRFLTILSHLGLSFQKDVGPDSLVPSGCFVQFC